MPSQQPNLEEQKPKFNLKYILIVLVLVILVVGGILAYAGYINKQITSINQISGIKESEVISCGTGLVYKPCNSGYYCEIPSNCEKNCQGICKKAESMNISSWQTYRNTDYRFQLNYPTQWKLGDSIKGIVQFYPDQDLIPPEIITERERSNLTVTREWPALTIQIFDNPDNLNLREAFNVYLLPQFDIEAIKNIIKTHEVIQEVKVNDYDAITVIEPYKRLRVYILSSNDQLIGIYLPSDEESVRGLTTSQTFYQIFSTFKFIK